MLKSVICFLLTDAYKYLPAKYYFMRRWLLSITLPQVFALLTVCSLFVQSVLTFFELRFFPFQMTFQSSFNKPFETLAQDHVSDV